MVDTGNPGDAQKILDALPANEVELKDIRLILITHCHSDHTGNLARLKELTGAKVAIHSLEAEALAQGRGTEICPVGIAGRMFKFLIERFESETFLGVQPDIRIEHELRLEQFGVQGKVISTSGHTPGSVSVILANGEVIIGDLIMGLFRPNIPGYPIFAYDMAQVKNSVRLIMESHPKKIHASHGGPFEPDAVLKKFGLL